MVFLWVLLTSSLIVTRVGRCRACWLSQLPCSIPENRQHWNRLSVKLPTGASLSSSTLMGVPLTGPPGNTECMSESLK